MRTTGQQQRIPSNAGDIVREIVGEEASSGMRATVDLVASDATIHEQLTRAAHARLGSPGSHPKSAFRELLADDALELLDSMGFSGQSLYARSEHALLVPLGTTIVLPELPFDDNHWAVTGVDATGEMQLARRLASGEMQHTTRQWPDLVAANPSLGSMYQRYPQGAAGVRTLRQFEPSSAWSAAQQADFELATATRPRSDLMYELVEGAGGRKERVVAAGTWKTLAQREDLANLKPLAMFPQDAFNAASLVDAAGPPVTKMIIGQEASALLGTSLLIGVNEVAPEHRLARDVAEIERVSQFFDGLGLPTWRDPGDFLTLNSGNLDSIGNASASGTSSYSFVNTGPRDIRTVDSIATSLDGETAHAIRKADDIVRTHWRGVLAHEVGHTATQQLWTMDAGYAQRAATAIHDDSLAARLVEHNVAEEAFSDLFGAAYSRSPDMGVRRLSVLRNGTGDLDQLRATIAANIGEISGHTGTQLLTKPMLEIAEVHGWDAMAEVTAGAAKHLGTLIGTGEIDAIDVPIAARALRDSAAARWGTESGVVPRITEMWTKLRVFT